MQVYWYISIVINLLKQFLYEVCYYYNLKLLTAIIVKMLLVENQWCGWSLKCWYWWNFSLIFQVYIAIKPILTKLDSIGVSYIAFISCEIRLICQNVLQNIGIYIWSISSFPRPPVVMATFSRIANWSVGTFCYCQMGINYASSFILFAYQMKKRKVAASVVISGKYISRRVDSRNFIEKHEIVHCLLR